MKIVKRMLMVLGGITVLFGIFIAILLMIDVEESLTEDEIALFKRMSEDYTHYINDNIEITSIEDMEYIPRDGIDYSSGDIKNAFDEFYGVSESVVDLSKDNAVYNDGKGDLIIEKTASTGTGGQKKPIYRGGGANSVKKSNKKDAFKEPDAWKDMGSVVIYYIYQQSDPGDNELPLEWSDPGDRDLIRKWSDPGDADIALKWSDPGDRELYKEWADPEFWSDIGDSYLKHTDDFNYDASVQFIKDEIARNAEEVWGDRYDLSGMGDVIEEYVEEYVEEWSDAGDGDIYNDPGDGDVYNDPGDMAPPDNIIKAKDFPINYKVMGRQFYREKLSKKQQLAYDVLATCIQRGEFTIRCELGTTVDESKAVLDAVLNDHPEFFFVRGYSYGATGRESGFNYTIESKITVGWVVITLDDEIMKIGIDKALKDITSKTKPVIAKARTIDSEIDKIKYIVDDLCDKNVYSKDGYDCKYGQNIYSAIVTNETVCAGFSKAFHYYMASLGVDATVLNSKNHMWNLLELDGEYYYMDVTWVNDDRNEIYTDYNGVQTETLLNGRNYEYFNFNDAYLAKALEEAPDYDVPFVRDYMGELLPPANGTKYSYKNWYGEDEVPDNTGSDPGHSEYADTGDNGKNEEAVEEEKVTTDTKDAQDKVVEKPKDTEVKKVDRTIIIDGVDVSAELDIIELNNLLYAEAESFIEAFKFDDPSILAKRQYNYADMDLYGGIEELLSEYEYDDELEGYSFIRDDLKPFINMDAVLVTSYATDTPIFLFFMDSKEYLIYDDYSSSFDVGRIEAAPRFVDGKEYIPMEIFIDLVNSEFEIY